MAYTQTSTGAYPLSERDIRAAHPQTSFPKPFVPPAGYAWVFPTPQPAFEPITHGVREIAPALSSKDEYEQQWEVYALDADQVAANIEAAKARLIDAATNKRWEVMTGGMTIPGGIEVGTTIDDQNRITSVVANAALAGLSDEDEVDFKAASGWARITIGQVKTIAGAIGQFVQACYTAERAHHEAIDKLKTPEQIRDYVIEDGWPDPVVETETT